MMTVSQTMRSRSRCRCRGLSKGYPTVHPSPPPIARPPSTHSALSPFAFMLICCRGIAKKKKRKCNNKLHWRIAFLWQLPRNIFQIYDCSHLSEATVVPPSPASSFLRAFLGHSCANQASSALLQLLVALLKIKFIVINHGFSRRTESNWTELHCHYHWPWLWRAAAAAAASAPAVAAIVAFIDQQHVAATWQLRSPWQQRAASAMA